MGAGSASRCAKDVRRLDVRHQSFAVLPPRRPHPKEVLPRKKAFPLIGMLFSGKPKGSVVQFPF